MKTHYFIAICILCCLGGLQNVFSQIYEIDAYNGQTINLTTIPCGSKFYDSGGSAGNYLANENHTVSFYSGAACKQVVVKFNSIYLENNYDKLFVYDGPTDLSPLIQILTGNSFSGTIVSTSNYLTFKFTSDVSIQYAGWDADIISCPTLSYESGCAVAAPLLANSNGVFSFSTPPGDGAVINSTTGVITNGTQGATYQVHDACWNLNATVTMINTPPCYNMNGDAQVLTVGGNTCVQLTPEANTKTGCAWSEQTVDFNSNFSLSLDYYFGDNPGGADGTTFTFQPNPIASCGQNGDQLGAGGIPNALIVEFDTYDNDGAANSDLACDHIAVETDGDLVRGSGIPPYCGPVQAITGCGSIENGVTHHVEIKWNAATQTLEVYFDGALRLTCNGDFVNTVFGGNNIQYWGATGATGALNNQQYFCPNTVVILGSTLESFDVKCQNNNLVANWQTSKEKNVDRYEIEYTHDGYVYYTYASVLPTGNDASTTQRYSLPIVGLDPQNTYFRIKTVDRDNVYKVSETVVAQNCQLEETLSIAYAASQLQISSKTMQDFSFNCYDLNGKSIVQGNSMDGVVNKNVSLISGVYFVTINYTDGKQVNKKIVIN